MYLRASRWGAGVLSITTDGPITRWDVDESVVHKSNLGVGALGSYLHPITVVYHERAILRLNIRYRITRRQHEKE